MDNCTYVLGWHDRFGGSQPGPYARICGLPKEDKIHDVAISVSVYAPEMLATGSNYDAHGNVWDVNDHLPQHRHYFEKEAKNG